jgi:hypothetical protein
LPKAWSVRAVVAFATAAGLAFFTLAAPATASNKIKDVSLEEYAQRTNDMIDSLADVPTKSYELSKEVFNLPKITQMRHTNGRALCMAFNTATRDGKLTKNELRIIVNTVWRNERSFIDSASASGWNNDDLSAMMMVNFTAIAMGVFMMCPQHTSLVSGRFSDSLYKTYEQYVN